MQKLSKELTIPQIEAHLKTLTTPGAIAAFVGGDKRKQVAGMQAARLTELQNPVKPLAVETAPDPATTRPRNAKEAKEVREQAAANRPHTKRLAGINPKSTAERKAGRNLQIAAQIVDKFTTMIHKNIDKLMDSYDEGFSISGNDEKYTHPFPATVRVIGENGDFDVKVEISRSVKERFTEEGHVHIPDAERDFIDAAEAGE